MAPVLAVMEKLNEEISAADGIAPSGRGRMKWHVARLCTLSHKRR